jgi:hypothetical protein
MFGPDEKPSALEELTNLSDDDVAALAALGDEVDAETLESFGVTERVAALRAGNPASPAGGAAGPEGQGTAPLAGSPEPDSNKGRPPASGSVPMPRFNEVIAERNATREELAETRRLLAEATRTSRELAEHVSAGTRKSADPPAPTQTPQEQLVALSQKFELGEVTLDEYMDQRDAVKEAARKPAAPQPDGGSLALQASTGVLLEANQWIGSLREAQFNDITSEAQALYEQRGFTRLSGERADLEYRKCFVEAGKTLGYDRLHAKTQPAAGPSGVPVSPGLKPVASSQPPDVSRGTQQVNGNGIPDESDAERFANMSASEISRLPANVLAELEARYLPT